MGRKDVVVDDDGDDAGCGGVEHVDDGDGDDDEGDGHAEGNRTNN